VLRNGAVFTDPVNSRVVGHPEVGHAERK